MDEKIQIARPSRQQTFQPIEDFVSDSDSEFEEREAMGASQTPQTPNGPTAGDLPPTYEESQAAIRAPVARLDSTTPPPTVPGYNNDVTVYRTELPPDPPLEYPVDEKQPLPDDTFDRPRASRLLNEALKFTETPPPVAERPVLRLPVAIPSFAGEDAPVRFARFYAPALNLSSVAANQFVEFIDGLNNLAIATNYSAAALARYQAGHGLIPHCEVTREDEQVGDDDLIPAYIALSNSHFFNPRGLRVHVVTLAHLAELLKISNEAIKKTILQEVLRMSRTGIDVPAAANGAAHQAASALMPYVEELTTAVPEPRKTQEALHAVAERFADLHVVDDEHDQAALDEALERSGTSPSSAGSSMAGPSRMKTWSEWGNDIGDYWGAWGDKQGKFWGKWGEDQGRKWGQWGENFGRKVEHTFSGPPAWAVGRRPPGSHLNFGQHGHMGSHGWTGRPDHWGGRHGSVPTLPWTQRGPAVRPAPHHMPSAPAIPGLPHVPGAHMPPAPPSIPMAHGVVAGVHIPTPPPPLGAAVPPMHPLHPPMLAPQHSMPGAFPPAASESAPELARNDSVHADEGDDQDFQDVDDKLSLSDISDTSSNSDSDDEESVLGAENPETMFAQKADYIERMAQEARARADKSEEQIESERSKALTKLELAKQKWHSKSALKAHKRQIKREVRSWKREVQRELKDVKAMDKGDRRVWAQERKADWRSLKQRLKAEQRQYKQERERLKREKKALAKLAKKEGKSKAWEDKRQEWESKREGERKAWEAKRLEWEKRREQYGREWEERRKGRLRRGGRRGGRHRGCGSVESLEQDLDTRAKSMLWIVVTKVDV